MLYADRDYDINDSSEQETTTERSRPVVTIENCMEKWYSVVYVRCKDRPKLFFDTVCTLTDMQYVVFHATVNAEGQEANQRGRGLSIAWRAIVAAESRVQQATIQQRRKWGGCLSLYWCFRSPRQAKRIGHAVLVPEPTLSGAAPSTAENAAQPPALVLPFIAPPSSPASFLHSEPPSATQSPAGILSFTSLSANSYSPVGPHSIFAIGPYAHETQLVSPPAFSTLTTEPSTAPFTPPPETVQLTTPSSPEVPFAKLLTSLDSSRKSTEACRKFPSSHYEFQSYQLYPGSPVGHLISPSSVISGSGTSSPFPDLEFTSGGCSFPPFRASEPPKLLSIDGLSIRKLVQQKDPTSMTGDTARPKSEEALPMGESQISEVASLANSDNNGSHSDELVGHRVSFELTAEEAAVCVVKEPPPLDGTASEASADPTMATAEGDRRFSETGNACECLPDETSDGSMEKASLSRGDEQQQQPSNALGTVKEFKFDNTEGASVIVPTVGPDWWANEKVVGVGVETGPNNWSFFSIIQPSVS